MHTEHQPSARSAIQDMADAVFSLSDDPCAANVVRYLVASQALEDSTRRPLGARARVRVQPTNSGEDDGRTTRGPVHR